MGYAYRDLPSTLTRVSLPMTSSPSLTEPLRRISKRTEE